MGSLHLIVGHRQNQTLSPRLQKAVQLLQMSSLDFSALVRSKLDDNPFLEEDEDAPAYAQADAQSSPITAATNDRELWMMDRHVAGRPTEGSDTSAMDLTPCVITLAMHLTGQLKLMPLSSRDLCITLAIVESLDDDGYLRTSLDEVSEILPLTPPVAPEEMRTGLRLVQSLEPAGVAARSVGECLALQSASIEPVATRQIAQAILEHHLEALASRDVIGLSKALECSLERVESAIASIRRLNPRPGWDFGSTRIDYTVPDVIVAFTQGRWKVQLNPAVIPRIRINEVYEELFNRNRPSARSPMSEHLEDAQWTVRNVKQRFSTILDIAQAIVQKQHLFLQFGAMAMKPLVLKEIAEEVGVHESTVSRVTNNKYMATPQGVFELKHFFSRPMLSASGKACSATAIRELIAEIIAAESLPQPLSDGEITRQLAAQGLVVARRTVTKYRQLMRIDSAEKRRRYA